MSPASIALNGKRVVLQAPLESGNRCQATCTLVRRTKTRLAPAFLANVTVHARACERALSRMQGYSSSTHVFLDKCLVFKGCSWWCRQRTLIRQSASSVVCAAFRRVIALFQDMVRRFWGGCTTHRTVYSCTVVRADTPIRCVHYSKQQHRQCDRLDQNSYCSGMGARRRPIGTGLFLSAWC